MNNLILVRHGQSLWNLERRFTGWTDIDLTEQGKSEAKYAGELINRTNIEFNTYFTSFQKRAINKKGKLRDKNFMFTGKLKNLSRAEAKSLVEQNSGSIVSTVNKRLNFLVTGEKPTNKKIEQAKQMNIKILSQDEWHKLLN